MRGEGHVFVLQHVHELPDGSQDVKFIGVYSTQLRARAAVRRLRKNPGFSDVPGGFAIDAYELDKDHWAEGYVTA